MQAPKKKILIYLTVLLWAGCGFFAWKTWTSQRPVPNSFLQVTGAPDRLELLDRRSTRLTTSYQDRWNIQDQRQLHEIPERLQAIFIFSEDKRFYRHSGVDWKARMHAVWQNLKALRSVRGASTISEQVVRMIHLRPRTLWSRWVEGIEAVRMENRISKASVLEFYLNQVPFASNRKGVVQAARYYFDRDIDTLDLQEMLCLAVLVRAPSRLDPYQHPDRIHQSINRLAERMQTAKMLTPEQFLQIQKKPLRLSRPALTLDASHFIHHVRSVHAAHTDQAHHQTRLKTTLDGAIQNHAQAALNFRVKQLKKYNVHNGALLVVDHHTNEILAWVVANMGDTADVGQKINAVLALRQPGSALKPFLYAKAIENGWTGATMINDTPLSEPVGLGLHTYQNYSRSHYGPVSLRNALGNSLNIPAIKTIGFVGVGHYLSLLHQLGFNHLSGHPDFYGNGLALGNAEVSLFDLVQAYTVLSRHGNFKPLTAIKDPLADRNHTRIFSKETTSIIGSILSDPLARHLEFGSNSVLNFPVQTAVKTGTSNDYKDALALGYNYRYTIGVWMGNLDGRPMKSVTGARGPAQVLRDLFSFLNQFDQTRPLYMSPSLKKEIICDIAEETCLKRTEWFPRNNSYQQAGKQPEKQITTVPYHPENNLLLAMDPRIPDGDEAFTFRILGHTIDSHVSWFINQQACALSTSNQLTWPLSKGTHFLSAIIQNPDGSKTRTRQIKFHVQ